MVGGCQIKEKMKVVEFWIKCHLFGVNYVKKEHDRVYLI